MTWDEKVASEVVQAELCDVIILHIENVTPSEKV